MSFDDAGTFEITTPGQPVSPHTVISSTNFNALMQDMAAGISTAICRDGQSTVTANIPMNGKKFTGLAPGTASTDSATLANIQGSTGIYVATVGGTADAITLSPSPAITAYAAGQTFRFIAPGTNTTNVTVNVSSLGAKAITKNGSTALVASDIPSGQMVQITYDGTRFILHTQGGATYLPLAGGTLTGNLTMDHHLLFTDATYDIGASGATRPRHGYFSGDVIVGANLQANGNLVGRVADGGTLFGLTLSNSGVDATNDIVVDIGTATNTQADASSRISMFLTSALTKQLDAAWAVGTNAGMLDTGSIANTTYHIYLIMSTAGVVDVLASTSASSPTMPGTYSYKRLIGSIIREAGAILPFTQDGDEVTLATPLLAVNATNPGTSAVTATLSGVPVGVSVRAKLNLHVFAPAASNTYVYVSPLTATDQAPSTSAAPLSSIMAVTNSDNVNTAIVRTNTSGQIRYRASASDGQTIVRIAVTGWFYTRGKDA